MKLKSREVERMPMDLTEKSQLMRNVNRRVKEITNLTDGTNCTVRPRLNELLSVLGHSLGERKKIIPHEFQLVHREVLQKLSKEYPTLTYDAKEQRRVYAENMQAPFVILSNRREHWFWNYERKEEKDAVRIERLPSPEDLEHLKTKNHQPPVPSSARERTPYRSRS